MDDKNSVYSSIGDDTLFENEVVTKLREKRIKKLYTGNIFTKKSNYPIYFTLPLLTYFGYLFYNFIQNPSYFTGLSKINIAIHEGGHAAVMMLGNQFLTASAGTIMQLLLPIVIMIGFFRQKDFFGFSLGFAWIGINLFHISVYAGDAKAMNLPMLQFFGEGNYIHDWNYMLSKLGVLGFTDFISNSIYVLAVFSFLLCFIFSFFLIINRIKK